MTDEQQAGGPERPDQHPSVPDDASAPPARSEGPDWAAIGRTMAESQQSRMRAAESRVGGPAPVDLGSAGAASTSSTGEAIHYSVKQTRHARDVLTRFHAVRRAARLYPFEHPAVADGVRDLFDSIRVYHDDGVELQFAFFEGEVLLGDVLLTEESVTFEQLIAELAEIRVGSLIFRRGLEEPELVAAMTVLSADPQEIRRGGGAEKLVKEAGTPHVVVSDVVMLDRPTKVTEVGEPTEEARAAFGSAVALLREIDRLLRAHRSIAPAKVKGVVRSLVDNVLTNRYAMLQLSGLKNYDEYTFYHSANVAILSLALGSTITNDYRFLSVLGTAALLHDIGKLSIDLSILNKPGPLDPEEWAVMREHPVAGAETTARMPGVDNAALVAILEHHMRWDGTGYPTRAVRAKQHLTSRIVAVADSYDAMTSQRSYSAARVQDEAMGQLAKGAGTSLDPALVRLFIGMMGVYPPRSVVRLSTGEVAVVIAPAEGSPLRPLVRVIAQSDGTLSEPRDIALVDAPDIVVEGCIDPRLVNIEVDDYI